MNGVLLTPLRQIALASKGDVWHAMKKDDPGFAGFGEAYFSLVAQDAVKGWKRHREMTLNLVCVQGAVRVVVHGDIDKSNAVCDVKLSPQTEASYQRLTVPPGLWVAFQGLAAGGNMLLNLASCMHDPQEAEVLDLEALPYDWKRA